MANDIPSRAVVGGRNHDLGSWRDDRYVACGRCNFTAHLDRDVRSNVDGDRYGDGLTQPSTQLNGAVTAGDTTITVDSTSGFSSSGYIYIYDTGVVNSTTGSRMNKVTYTGTSSTTFTGCTKATAHDDDMDVKGDTVGNQGCPQCGTMRYEIYKLLPPRLPRRS